MIDGGNKSSNTFNTYTSPYDTYNEEEWDGKVGTQPTFSDYALSELIGQTFDDKKRQTDMQIRLKAIDASRYMAALNYYKKTGKATRLTEYFAKYYHKEGFVTGAFNERTVADAKERDRREREWIRNSRDTAVAVAGAIPYASGAVSVTIDRISEDLENRLANNTKEAIVGNSDVKRDRNQQARLNALTLLLNSNMFTQRQLRDFMSAGNHGSIVAKDEKTGKLVIDKKLIAGLRSTDETTRILAEEKLDNFDRNKSAMESPAASSVDGTTSKGNGKDFSFNEGYKRAKDGEERDGKKAAYPNKFSDNKNR